MVQIFSAAVVETPFRAWCSIVSGVVQAYRKASFLQKLLVLEMGTEC